MQEQTKRILVGRISGIYGIRGCLKIKSYTHPPENIFTFHPWYIKRDGCWQEIKVIATRIHGKRLIAEFEGVTDRDIARAWINMEISILRSQLVDLPPGQFYWADLIGMKVKNQGGVSLGTVTEILETGANAVMVVQGTGRYLIPVIRDMYILKIDQDKGLIRVVWDIPE
jgi:16S rRNA processing protein RimM